MCTVTYLPGEKGYYLSSNRDEKLVRAKAIPPQKWHINGWQLGFPKDGQAGGTWIAIHEKGHSAVLLNGAAALHQPLPQYRRSRGLIFLDVIGVDNPVSSFQEISLTDIEPFTLILVLATGELYECRWNGLDKKIKSLPAQQAYIWSSVTLYTAPVIRMREEWFRKWQQQYPLPDQDAILGFHLFGGEGNPEQDIRMQRGKQYQTVSITGIHKDTSGVNMRYLDLLNMQETQLSFSVPHAYAKGGFNHA